MPISGDKWPFVVDTIRAVHQLTPILVFGGHLHIRDCRECVNNDRMKRIKQMTCFQYSLTVGLWHWQAVDTWRQSVSAFTAVKNTFLTLVLFKGG